MGVVSLSWEALQWRRETQARPENGPIPVLVSTAPAPAPATCSGWLWSLCSYKCAKFCFSLSHAFPPVSHPGCWGPQGFSSPVLPLAMKKHFNHPGLTEWGVLPKLKHKWALTARRAVVITGSPLQSPLPEKVPPLKLGALPGGGKDSSVRRSRALSQIQELDPFPVLRSLGQIKFPLPPVFSDARLTK